jgi:hypothetical protein
MEPLVDAKWTDGAIFAPNYRKIAQIIFYKV